ncbi:16S rRNA (guanine(527)-N(7))-methyltransferase RsmG [Salinivirga cyanobacteriivorans]|uniref:Ribosomal RNA small subunit methyltransferase G n=1 Tax=Salinivirga cyanobacteriivorans TaxID=1307839 RepID=A0A0S2HX13_9BACT|nr:16S rRNA (guanine(527)-N(7))-methyltransferase RsmG [Salinivirga cyanobacteriivorans]ALO14568.1 Ribosomal RNA small subunit methyltransferase G [Salinivirga cyanobacteriivorans]
MDEILRFFPKLDNTQKARFEKLYALYTEWNAKINVISRKDIDHLYIHHVLHSLAIYKFLRFNPGSKIMDVGTGGGFPGIPLAIMQPDCHFTLVDSIGKKIKVANAVAEALELKNVKAIQARAEKVKDRFDFIVSRAVMPLPKFTKLTMKKLKKEQINALPNGIIYLKGGDFENELQELDFVHADVFDIADYFDLPFFETKKVVYITH